ncbi:hypothetical protein OS175_13855 [Marinicella sp. S1101]|uniref:hypothetical protein n=1 Tax=Marinicella marina TaxID=2996016 RepID=UPI002260F542|nr:hypothetical protein [Marinicella marina]MCX7554957.1 hypothetical protein [Marinicella marina]MDJ1141567.1 hypothetical protein [Marinicella marina]
MQSLFIINEKMNTTQVEQSYLLILAMLNFEHSVDVVFSGAGCENLINSNAQLKKWTALKLYGVNDFYHLTADSGITALDTTALSTADFENMKNQAAFLS